MGRLGILLLVTVELTFVAVAILAQPQRIADFDFWVIVAWLSFLAALNWAVSSYIFFKVGDADKSTSFGTLPSLNIVVFLYSIASVTLLVSSWYTVGFGIMPNWHLIAQVVAAGSTASIFLLILISSKGAEIELPKDVKTTRELSALVETLISTLPPNNQEVLKELKNLLEFVNYSMPHTARLNSFQNYEKLSSAIHELNSEILEETGAKDRIVGLLNLAKDC
jgi:hypothetical protein